MEELDKEIVLVVKNIAKAVKKHGVKKVIAALDKLDNQKTFEEVDKNLTLFIIDEVSAKFQVNPKELSNKNIRGLKVQARSMCFVLIKKHLKMSHQSIVGLFGGSNHSIVSSALREFENLNCDIKSDRLYLDIYREIEAKVEKRKDNLWLKHS
jgi:chromosomal replication initiation ATPase DnaA